MIQLPAADIRRAVRAGLEEDLGGGDITTTALRSEEHTSELHHT